MSEAGHWDQFRINSFFAKTMSNVITSIVSFDPAEWTRVDAKVCADPRGNAHTYICNDCKCHTHTFATTLNCDGPFLPMPFLPLFITMCQVPHYIKYATAGGVAGFILAKVLSSSRKPASPGRFVCCFP